MKKNLIYLFIFFSLAGKAQQTTAYSQYLFNAAGLNPAASGIDINQKLIYVAGLNRQWTDLNNSPKATFVNLSYTIRPPRSYHFWQNVGVYVDNDQAGLFSNTGIYGNYTLHLLIRKKLVASFGIYAGIRKYTRSVAGLDVNDPAVQKNASSVLLYPDLIPGVRLSGKKFFTDLSIRQITIPKLQDFKGHKIGSPSTLQPSIYYDYGRKIPLMDDLLMIPSFAVNMPLVGPPIVNVSALFYYATRIGGGLAIRNTSFASAIFQIRFLENVTAGFSYSYPLNATRYAAQNSFEIMVGVTPMGMNSKAVGRHSVSKCPTLDF
jgi:type IX secretion system PorP/SprF family membrane protein